MPRNGSGVMVRETPVATGTTAWLDTKLAGDVNITTVDHDFHDQDLADALTSSIAVDGQSVITADIPFNNHKITGLANGVAATDAAALGQLATGGLYLIQTQTVSSPVASVSFTGLTTTYNTYIIRFYDVYLSTNVSTLQVRVQQSATFQTTGYPFAVAFPIGGAVTSTATTNGSSLVINQTVGTGNACSGTIELLYPNGPAATPAVPCIISINTGGLDSGAYMAAIGSGFRTGTAAAVTGLQFLAPGSNLTSGIFSLYGVKS